MQPCLGVHRDSKTVRVAPMEQQLSRAVPSGIELGEMYVSGWRPDSVGIKPHREAEKGSEIQQEDWSYPVKSSRRGPVSIQEHQMVLCRVTDFAIPKSIERKPTRMSQIEFLRPLRDEHVLALLSSYEINRVLR